MFNSIMLQKIEQGYFIETFYKLIDVKQPIENTAEATKSSFTHYSHVVYILFKQLCIKQVCIF